MRKLLLGALTVLPITAMSINFQLHYDMRKWVNAKPNTDNYFTLTAEHFGIDKLGTTYFFADFDFNGKAIESNHNAQNLAYFELARTFFLGNLPISAHLEYNGGITNTGAINSSYLVGVNYATQAGAFNLSMYAAYKFNAVEIYGSHDVQYTFVWDGNFANDKLTFCGYIDLYSQPGMSGKKEFGMTAEPQLWYNFNKHIALGTEFEFSYNFYNWQPASNQFCWYPTLGFKFTL